MRRIINYFSVFEMCLVTFSSIGIIALFLINNDKDILTLMASLCGIISLIFVAKGNVVGQFFGIGFSILYTVISFKNQYYGEMITYLGMTAPSAAFSAFTWIKNPYSSNEVKVATMTKKKWLMLFFSTVVVTIAFYFILKFFNTANLTFSTISVATSFLASILMMLRSPYYAIAYSSNDVVLIVLWILASLENPEYFTMVLLFGIFLINDIYGYVSWTRMTKKQAEGK